MKQVQYVFKAICSLSSSLNRFPPTHHPIPPPKNTRNHVLAPGFGHRAAPPPPRTRSSLRYLLFLLWLSASLATSLLLFTNGFLLRRQVLEARSNSTAAPPVFAKAVVVVVDALRHDFALWEEEEDASRLREEERHFRNRMPVVRELQREGTAKVQRDTRLAVSDKERPWDGSKSWINLQL